MALAERLRPRHRLPITLPGPWPACAQGLLRDGAFWLHGDGWGGSLLVLPGGPLLESRWDGDRWVTLLDGREAGGTPFNILEKAVAGAPPWVGALSYELACGEAGLPCQVPVEGMLGQAWRGATLALHVDNGRAEAWSWGEPPTAEVQDRLAVTCALERPRLGGLSPRWGEGDHRDAVEAIRARILDGGFYVANLCVPFDAAWSGDAVTLALSSFRRAAPPYGAFLPLGPGGPILLCLSMERVLSKSGARLRSEPIKGSAPRAGDPAADEAAGKALALDPKERAEHTMIVDLVRNDLGRVAERGTVRVAELMALKAYPTVQHLVSCVEARARPDAGLAEIFRAVLPGGSVTGAPKNAVCGHIASAEAAPRGFYCGALGWIHGTDFELALPIRTAQIDGGKMVYWAGGGITLRSDPAKEWRELRLKTRAMEPG